MKDVTTSEEERIGPDNKTLNSRTGELSQNIAKEIKSCANACDTYKKRAIFSKILMRVAWDEYFARFIRSFAKQKVESVAWDDFARFIQSFAQQKV